jgi:hypothetical protein
MTESSLLIVSFSKLTVVFFKTHILYHGLLQLDPCSPRATPFLVLCTAHSWGFLRSPWVSRGKNTHPLVHTGHSQPAIGCLLHQDNRSLHRTGQALGNAISLSYTTVFPFVTEHPCIKLLLHTLSALGPKMWNNGMGLCPMACGLQLWKSPCKENREVAEGGRRCHREVSLVGESRGPG